MGVVFLMILLGIVGFITMMTGGWQKMQNAQNDHEKSSGTAFFVLGLVFAVVLVFALIGGIMLMGIIDSCGKELGSCRGMG